MAEESKVVVIHIKPGEPVKIGETQLKVKRWRNGRVELEVIGTENVSRSLTSEPDKE